jgi:DivIVA domain-containing protein
MEITPQELRDVEITEAFRGYNREAVNDLLERAASAVESANERVRELSERLKATQLEADRSRETEEILHRTLLLAQRAADESVAEAQQKSRDMLEDAELKSHKLVSDAETEAQRRGDAERIRIEDEIIDLASRRDALLADVDALTEFETEFRTRVTGQLEADLERVRNRETAAPGQMPEPHSVEIPAFAERLAPSGRTDDAVASESELESPAGEDVGGTPAANGSDASGERIAAHDEFVPAGDDSGPDDAGEPTGQVDMGALFDGEAQAPAESASEPAAAAPSGNGADAAHGEAFESSLLDDDAFFASLREAVSDDTPLGPRDDSHDEMAFAEDDDRSSLRDVFRRRR